MRHALISIRPKYVESILVGKKTVEFRRRNVNLLPGQWLLVYTTKPRACLELVARVGAVTAGEPVEIWNQFGSMSGISAREYYRYVDGSKQAAAIELADITVLKSGLSLESLRALASGFHPPQFFRWLESDSPIISSCRKLLPGGPLCQRIMPLSKSLSVSSC